MDGARVDGRAADQLRPFKIINNYLMYPAGSVLVEAGNTKVICTACVEEKTAKHLTGTGQGWVTAEYGMLPGSTGSRKARDASRGKVDGRSTEIQRLIGRSLRSVVDMDKLGERTIRIDCDVIQADGGTRTASVTGAFVAMVEAMKKMKEQGLIGEIPVRSFVSAVSVGKAGGRALLDLCYEEDSQAQVDMNVIMTDRGEYIEVQGTGEQSPFSEQELMELLALAKKGCGELHRLQAEIIGDLTPAEEKRVTVVAATQNKHKIEEISAITGEFGMDIVSRRDAGVPDFEVVEDGDTFEYNSEKKAREIMEVCQKITIADDSGLMVDALDGAPGVYSARFAGDGCDDEANNDKLLELLRDVPMEKRTAKFVSVITMVFPGGETLTARGECPGHVAFERRGDNGFGYDPLFVPEGYEQSFAELSGPEKNKISHRARALQKLRELLTERSGR